MRMMQVSNDVSYRRNRRSASAKLALLQFIAAGIALIAFCAIRYSVSGGNNGYVSIFFDVTESYPIAYISREHVVSMDMPVLYAYSLLLLTIHSLVVGIGLLKKRRWAWKWARITPVTTLPLWVPLIWHLAESFALARAHYRVSSDDSSNPLILAGEIRTAALYCVLPWLVTSLIYLRKLKRSESSTDLVGASTSAPKMRVIRAIVLVTAALLLLLNFRMPDGRILIHDTVSYGWTGVANALRILGQSVNARTSDGSTPLHFAAGWGRLDTAESLLEHGADINAQDRLGCTAAVFAAESDWSYRAPNADPYATAIMLIKHGADVRIRDHRGLTVANHIIGQTKYPSELVRLMVERGVSVNVGVTGEWVNYTLLGYTVEYGRPADVDYLLSHGARMYPRLVVRATPGMLRHLLDRGFDVNSRDEDGKTPLQYVLEREQMSGTDDGKACALVLLEHGADINAKDKRNQTLLDIASQDGDSEWVRFLLNHGADLSIGD